MLTLKKQRQMHQSVGKTTTTTKQQDSRNSVNDYESIKLSYGTRDRLGFKEVGHFCHLCRRRWDIIGDMWPSNPSRQVCVSIVANGNVWGRGDTAGTERNTFHPLRKMASVISALLILGRGLLPWCWPSDSLGDHFPCRKLPSYLP